MFDDERSTGRVTIDPGQLPVYKVIPPARPSIPFMSTSKAADSRPLRLDRDSKQHPMLPSFEKSKARPLGIDLTSIDGKHLSLEKRHNSCSGSPNLTVISGFLSSIPPDTQDALFALIIRFLVFLGNAGQTPQKPSIPAESSFKEALELILKAKGLRNLSESADPGEEFQKNVKTVWDEIDRFRYNSPQFSDSPLSSEML